MSAREVLTGRRDGETPLWEIEVLIEQHNKHAGR